MWQQVYNRYSGIDLSDQRKIIHIDMDAFFASVEQRDFPQYRNKPVIVGGTPENRGVVAACSYEARKFGIHSAMPSAQAVKRCPDAIFVRPRFEAYKQCSQQIRAIFHQYTELVEPLSLDEAYLDVTGSTHCNGSATLIAKEIKEKIKQQLNLTASAGVSYNKFLAKTASDMDKPDGIFVILPEQAEALLEGLEVRKFYGIGKATEAKMKQLGIHTGADLKRHSQSYLSNHFGKSGLFYYHIVRGVDHRQVSNNRVRKSIGSETTFVKDILSVDELMPIILKLSESVIESLKKYQLQAQTITLKVRYQNFQISTRSQTETKPFDDLATLMDRIPQLMERTEIGVRPIRLIGVTTSSLSAKEANDDQHDGEQLSLI